MKIRHTVAALRSRDYPRVAADQGDAAGGPPGHDVRFV